MVEPALSGTLAYCVVPDSAMLRLRVEERQSLSRSGQNAVLVLESLRVLKDGLIR